jgi:hypothetical protein
MGLLAGKSLIALLPTDVRPSKLLKHGIRANGRVSAEPPGAPAP